MTYPRLSIEMCRTETDGRQTLLDTPDVTATAIEYLSNPRFDPGFSARPLPPVSIGMFLRDMTQPEEKAFRAGTLHSPGLAERVATFVAACGGHRGVVSLGKHLSAIRNAEFDIQRAEEILRLVTAAELAPDGAAYDMYCPRWTHHDYVGELSDAYDGWHWEEYCRLNPRPEFDAPEAVAWQEAYSAWARMSSPPFVFATIPARWPGIDPKDVRQAQEDDEVVDIAWLIESGLQEHHEDAETLLVDPEALDAIIDRWLPQAASGSPGDLALEAELAEWNARQVIVSYYEDTSVVVAVRAGEGKAEIVAWAEADLARRRLHLEHLQSSWQPPAQGDNDSSANASSSFTAA